MDEFLHSGLQAGQGGRDPEQSPPYQADRVGKACFLAEERDLQDPAKPAAGKLAP